MDSKVRQQIEELYRAALECAPETRATFLDRECPDVSLRREVESLLASPGAAPLNSTSATDPSFPGGSGANWFTGTERFQLVRQVGAGGMGVVYEAFDRERQMRVALKTLPRMEGHLLAALKREFRSLAGISHPNLAQLYELISEAGRWFFTMEFIDGVDFHRYVARADLADQPTVTIELETLTAAVGVPDVGRRRTAPRPPRADIGLLRAALRQLAEGVHALHGFGKLHLDIKPTNVMVKPAGELRLLDFGLARDVQGKIEGDRHMISGTLRYMAPEQAFGGELTPAADWYAVGCTLFEALTGEPAFRGTARAVLLAKRDSAAPAPCELAVGVPEDLDRLCLDLIQPDPARRPDGAEILRRLGVDCAAAASPRDAEFMIGRGPQLEALEAAFERACSGETARVFVHGHSGFGKTTLIREFLRRVTHRGGALVLQGRCYEQETVPYKAFDSIIDALGHRLEEFDIAALQTILPPRFHALVQIFPVLARFTEFAPRSSEPPETDSVALRRQAIQALRELLLRLCAIQPVVLFIEDLQWGDLDSAGLLTEILRPPSPMPLLVVCAYRTEHAATSLCIAALSELEREEIEVGPLSPGEGREMAHRLLGSGEAARADAIAREANGNPYFLRELASRPSGGAEVSLDEILWLRAQAVPEAARRMLELIALSGQPLRQTEAFRAAGLEQEDVSLLLDLRAGRLVRTTGLEQWQEVEVYHDRIRECISARLDPAVQVQHHRRLAVTLESSGDHDPERVGGHYEAAGEMQVAGRYYAQAGDQASAVLAFDRACALYQRSMALGGEEERRQLMVRLADALASAGRGPEAARQYRLAAAAAHGSERLHLEERAAYHFCASGYVDEGLQAYGAVLANFGTGFPASPRRALAATLGYGLLLELRRYGFRERAASAIPASDLLRADTLWAASTGVGMVDQAAAGAFAKRALLAALHVGEPFRVARSLAWEGVFLAALGPRFAGKSARTLATARSIALRSQEPAALGWIHLAESFVGLHCGDWAQAHREGEEAERTFREQCRDVPWERTTAQTCLQMGLVACGGFRELAPRAPEWLEDANRRGNLYGATTVQGWVTPHLRLAAGDPAGARRASREAAARWTPRGFHLQHILTGNTAIYACLYEGDGAGAMAEAERHWAAAQSSLVFRVLITRAWTTDARARAWLLAAATAAQPRPLLRGVLKMARALDREGVVWTAAAAARLRAGAAYREGRRDRALALLRRSEQLTGLAGMPQFLAPLRLVIARLAVGEEGRRMQALAREWFEQQQIADPARFAALHVPGFED